jgi:putative hydrolase of the HAD superfamily
MRRITGLLLDVDDTLIDTRAAMVAAGEVAVGALWPELGAQVRHSVGVHFHADPGDFFGRFSSGELSFSEMRLARLADLLASFSLAAVDNVDELFWDTYTPAFAANVRLFDDVLALVDAARAAGIQLGLLTNSSARLTQQKLEITALVDVFAVVATRDTLGFGKPDARAFHHACRLLGSAPAQTLYVGDHIEIDAIAAGDAGLSAVWLQRDSGDLEGASSARSRGIPIVTSLSQVPALW